ncbi:Delta(1)-pyrroline-2-carboxylate reductase [Streptomyces hundungensis]|uniref:Delta(1)-pyrroline-2-carboxylate reductase n=1 Tax=Streptomyces hundungensis TaxID=1077946 RepID=A0A387HGF9_9ACTN|nr:Delta(1)-pyrroline-2-carboxylate reductase [Streptomyces hundungensis]
MIHLGADDLAALLTPAAAVEALAGALRAGLDPEQCPRRSNIPVPAGELLVMPAASATYAGVKVAGVAPANPARGLPRITGGYLLLDGPTLLPLAMLDAAALTTLRTAAVSALAIDALAEPDTSRLVLFGAGPQAYAHLESALDTRELTHATVVSRSAARAERLVTYARELGLEARTGSPADVSFADLVICCTTAHEPLFEGRRVPAHATVVAVGSHQPTVRETDSELVRRSSLWVEARTAALREAGDLLIPLADGVITESDITGTLAALVGEGARPPADRPRLFKSVGMAWQDLVVAGAAHAALAGARSARPDLSVPGGTGRARRQS